MRSSWASAPTRRPRAESLQERLGELTAIMNALQSWKEAIDRAGLAARNGKAHCPERRVPWEDHRRRGFSIGAAPDMAGEDPAQESLKEVAAGGG